ncbi:phosphoglycolate phosphatase [Faucicola mancuniensis]|uniref:phosphoglycolate phosphatase n=1 Tax=Faucicola mancuniensis TaxID=1309795 RepID=UPI0028EC8C2C|nr:phosphoglycolate phosphatase [uncultured Moraxella sp.]
MKNALLIFDLDGTLIDSVPDIAIAVNQTLSDLQRQNFDENQIRNWVGNGAKVLIQRALTASQSTDVDEIILDNALQRFFYHYAQKTCEKTIPYQGVTDGLNRLKQAGYTLSIVTNKPAQFVPAIVQTLGWQGLFSHILGGDSLPVKKPDPLPLLTTCQTLGFDVADSYMIGDSKNDVLAGKNAGMTTLALSYGYNYGEDIRSFEPDMTFDSFADLTQYLLN